MTGGLVRLQCPEGIKYEQVTTDLGISPEGHLLEAGLLNLFAEKGPYSRGYNLNVNTHILLPLGAL